ncbi:MAG: shikimate dehydrogenase, partial [Candidatus Magasanikiibacteriota bacterium]
MNAVIGYPLEHSLSPVLHNELYRLLDIENEFIKFESDDIDFLVKEIKEKKYELVSVTMPHKQSIIQHLDEVDGVAKKIGAVNTVINKNGKLTGYNTDVYGIEYVLHNVDIKNKNVLIIGAGGVARPVAYYISNNEGNLFYINRTRDKAEILKKDFGGEVVEMENLKSEEIDIIINTTSIGMYPDDNMPIDKNFLTNKHTIFDVIYNPIKTNLLIEAEKCGAKIISGLDMFIA